MKISIRKNNFIRNYASSSGVVYFYKVTCYETCIIENNLFKSNEAVEEGILNIDNGDNYFFSNNFF